MKNLIIILMTIALFSCEKERSVKIVNNTNVEHHVDVLKNNIKPDCILLKGQTKMLWTDAFIEGVKLQQVGIIEASYHTRLRKVSNVYWIIESY